MSDSENVSGGSRSPSPAHIDATSAGYYNPALALDDNDVTITVDSGRSQASEQAGRGPTAGSRTWERFDDDESVVRSGGAPATQQQTEKKSTVTDSNQNSTHHQNGNAAAQPRIVAPPKTNKTADQPSQTSASQETQGVPHQTSLASQQVHYDVRRDQAVVNGGSPVVAGAPGGGAVIMTRNIPEYWRDVRPERPLRATRMKMLKIFSILAVILFFPTGIPAAYFAWRTQKEFDEGIMRGNIDRAQKLARRTEHLIILSAVLAVMTAVLVFALVERAQRGDVHPHGYIAHDSVQG